jgi:Rieske Fe-S protein
VAETNLLQIPTRREFCACCARSAALVALGGAAGCGGGPTSPSGSSTPLASVSGTVSGRTISVSLAAGALATVGALAITQTSIGNFLLARTGDGTVTALTAVCTHEGCTVSNFSGSQFVCPCHGSTFNTSGAVANGPANRALQQFPAQVAGGVVTFTV